MQNGFNPQQRPTEQLQLITTETIQIMFWGERDFPAVGRRSTEVFRNNQYLCSIRINDAGMGADVNKSVSQAKLRNNDILYHVDLSEHVLYLSGSLTTRDKYHPSYNAQVTFRVNNPSAFLQCYFDGQKDVRRDPINRIKTGIERALRRYAETVEHDKLKRRELEAASKKSGEGRSTGIWIERSFVDFIEDPLIQRHRQRIRDIQVNTEVEKIVERSKAEVQTVRSGFAIEEDSKRKEYERVQRSKDTHLQLEEEVKKQMYVFQQKTREILFSTVNQKWADYILIELDKVDNSVPELFRVHPEILQYFPALNQLYALPQPQNQRALGGPSSNTMGQGTNNSQQGGI